MARDLSRISVHAAAGLALVIASTAASPLHEEPRAARQLNRGIVLTADDIVGAEDAAPIGWITRRVIREGEVLRPPAIARAPIIKSGAAVRALHSKGAISIIRSAQALTDAAAGDTVLVRLDRRTSAPAIVLDSTTVRLLPHFER